MGNWLQMMARCSDSSPTLGVHAGFGYLLKMVQAGEDMRCPCFSSVCRKKLSILHMPHPDFFRRPENTDINVANAREKSFALPHLHSFGWSMHCQKKAPRFDPPWGPGWSIEPKTSRVICIHQRWSSLISGKNPYTSVRGARVRVRVRGRRQWRIVSLILYYHLKASDLTLHRGEASQCQSGYWISYDNAIKCHQAQKWGIYHVGASLRGNSTLLSSLLRRAGVCLCVCVCSLVLGHCTIWHFLHLKT